MQLEYLTDLRAEIKKYKGFMTPESVRKLASDAVKYLSQADIDLPIHDSSNPIILAFCQIIENKKTAKTAAPLIVTICDCLRVEILTGDALSAITRKLETLEGIDSDTALKIIRFLTIIIRNHFLEMDLLQSMLSLLLSFCDFEEELVSQTSSAAACQVVSGLLEFADENGKKLTAENKRDIDLCFSMACDNSVEFDAHMNKVIYLVTRDIVRTCTGQSALWLRIKSLPVTVGYGILGSVIQEHGSVFNTSPHFQRLIMDAAAVAKKQGAPLSFCVGLILSCMDSLPTACATIFKDFLTDLDRKSPDVENAILFFRILLLKNATVIVNFCLKCDRNAKLLSKMMRRLREICKDAPKEQLDLSLGPRSYDYQIQHPVRDAIEITLFFVHSCYKAQNGVLKVLISNTWEDILMIFSVAGAVVSGKHCHMLVQGIHSLVFLTHELMLEDARGSAISAFCDLLVAPKGPQADEVRKMAYETVSTAIETDPSAFKGHWNKLMNALSGFSWHPASFDFVLGLPSNQIVEICLSLFSVDDWTASSREWSLFLLVDLLIANMSRFDSIWPSVEGYFCLLMDDAQAGKSALEAFVRLLSDGFTDKSEKALCVTMSRLFMGANRLGAHSRLELLECIRQLLSKMNDVLRDGWPFLLTALKPRNFQEEANILDEAFRSVQMISNDMIFNLSQQIQLQTMQLILEYGAQTIDINVSLTSFGLLWNIASVCKTEEMWRLLFDQIAPFIGHHIPDVSLCAVNTFFSLIVSNAQAIPRPIFHHIAADLFMPIVHSLTKLDNESAATQQLAFHELAHCGRNLWDEFKDVEVFRRDFWHQLITNHESFIISVQRKDTKIAAFMFYEEMFQCSELDSDLVTELFDSIDRVTDYCIANETVSSALLGSLGRIIRAVLPTQRDRMTDGILKRWLKIIEHSIIDVDSSNYLPATAHKAMDALVLLLPLSLDLTVMVYKSLVKIAGKEPFSERLAEVAIDHISEICEKKVPTEFLPTLFIESSPLFGMKAARRLLLNFVEKDIEVQQDKIEVVAKSLMDLGKEEGLQDKTATAVMKMFERLDTQTMLLFVDTYRTSFFAISEVLRRFCDPTSETFSKEISSICTKKLLEHFADVLRKCSNDQKLGAMLKFIYHLKIDTSVYGVSSQQIHLYILMTVFADLILHPDAVIRKRLRKIFLVIGELRDFSSV